MRGLLVLTLVGATVANAQPPAADVMEYNAKVREGIDALVGDDYATAISAFRRAIGLIENKGAAHCFLGDAMKLQGRLPAALESYQTCSRISRQTRDTINEARGLMGIARTHLAMEGHHDEARQAIVALLRFSEAHVEVVVPSVPRDMLQHLDAIIELDAVSSQVRERREARAAAASSDS